MNGIWRRISAEPAVHRAGSDSPHRQCHPRPAPSRWPGSQAGIVTDESHGVTLARALRPALDATNLIPPAP